MGAATSMTDAVCGNCDQAAGSGVQFCARCGQPLWQVCPECRISVLLTQQYCNGCGSNLLIHFEKQIGDANKLLDRCEKIALEGKFDQSSRLASMLVKPSDYRFKEVASRASKIIAESESQSAHWANELTKLSERANRYASEDRTKDLVALLEPVPPGVLTEELAKLLANNQQKLASLSSCKRELKKALAEKRYTDAVGCLAQIVELNPTSEKYKRQLGEVAAKVRAKAEAYGNSGQFAKAVQMLQSLPANFKDEEFLARFNSYEEAVYLRELLAKATYYTPLLPGVLDRLEKITPGDEKIEVLKRRAGETRKRSKSLFTEQWPEWMKPETGTLGIPIVPIKIPAAFPGAHPECISTRGSQFMVALGLGIQAVHTPMPKGDFLAKEAPKGFMSKIFSRKSDLTEFGWGIDIGDSSIKAVRVRFSGDPARAHIDNAVQIPLEVKPGQGKLKKLDEDVVVAALKKLAADFAIGDQPVVINFPGNELITRFVLLPPTADKKKYDDFVLQDGRANIPMPMDMVYTALHVSDGGGNERIVPSGILVAGKKSDIDGRKALVESAGVKVTGIMPEPFALWNALQAISQVEVENNIAQGETSDGSEAGRTSRADLLIDVGHQRTNILISHPKGLWFRTLDWGLADMSHAISNAQQLTYGEAEKMRREPLRASHLQIPMDAMLSACQVPRRELERSAYVARESIGELRLRRAMLVGGGVFQPFLSCWLNGSQF
jgi:Tfp pilus assembly PilM family ATPase/tetratricopeptide (TPR) repeat protein